MEGEMPEEIEVFQDLYLNGPLSRRAELRNALIEAAVNPWRVDLERSAQVLRNAVSTDDVVLFRREATDLYPEVGLTLWAKESGYYVPNINPLRVGQLTYAQYNAVLQDFVETIAAPIAPKFGFEVQASKPREALEDWLSDDAARKLRIFSDCANKSTGTGHPLDQARWFDFLITAHRENADLDAETLRRWLHEVDTWDEEWAHRLAGDYERSMDLLKYNDEH
jgi:hypothetical protein